MRKRFFVTGLLFGILFAGSALFSAPKLFSETEEKVSLFDKVRQLASDTDPRTQRKKAHRIAVGDKMKIKVYPEDQYVKGGEWEVSSEGTVTLNLIGKISVEGKTVAEVEREMTELLAKDFLVNPVVVVEVDETEQSKESLAILGQIQRPGTYDFPEDEKLTLLQLISKAGGFTPVANVKKIKVIRKEKEKKTRVIRANAEAIISGKEADVELQPDDVIHVGESFF